MEETEVGKNPEGTHHTSLQTLFSIETEHMKLSYRGVNYEFTLPNLEVTEGEILGMYRGVSWRCNTLLETSIPRVDRTLNYPNVCPYTNQTSNSGVGGLRRVASSKSVSDFSLPKAFSARKETERIHRMNLLRNLERRLQVAKERGDQNLITLLEAESRQIVC